MIINIIKIFIQFINEKQFKRFCSCKNIISIPVNFNSDFIFNCDKCHKSTKYFKTGCHICNNIVFTTKIKDNNTCPYHANIHNISINIIINFKKNIFKKINLFI